MGLFAIANIVCLQMPQGTCSGEIWMPKDCLFIAYISKITSRRATKVQVKEVG